MAEWLRRLTRNQIPSGSVGSNPTDCVILTFFATNNKIFRYNTVSNYLLVRLVSSCGRVVKASDLKSDSLWERRFESYQLRD